MYPSKVLFDRSTARLLARRSTSSRPNVVFAVYGSAQRTFEQAHRYGIPTVLHFVNSHPVVHNQLLRDIARLSSDHHEMIPAWVERRVQNELAIADRILVPSKFVAAQLSARGVHDERLVVLPYGVDVGQFLPPRKHREYKARLSVLFVGQISHRKGITTLMEVARAARTFADFRMLGPVVSAELLKHLPPNVQYLGSAANQNVPDIMIQSDVLVLPSYEDSYGLVVLEAMASALPVIVTSNVGAAEFVRDGETGYVVPPGRSAQLLAALALLDADRDLGRRMGAAARASVASQATWEQYAAAAVHVMRDLLSATRH
jgi:glycosyltransferase involved in cell wall biosynthesis